jgi:hypothetical protein
MKDQILKCAGGNFRGSPEIISAVRPFKYLCFLDDEVDYEEEPEVKEDEEKYETEEKEEDTPEDVPEDEEELQKGVNEEEIETEEDAEGPNDEVPEVEEQEVALETESNEEDAPEDVPEDAPEEEVKEDEVELETETDEEQDEVMINIKRKVVFIKAFLVSDFVITIFKLQFSAKLQTNQAMRGKSRRLLVLVMQILIFAHLTL